MLRLLKSNAGEDPSYMAVKFDMTITADGLCLLTYVLEKLTPQKQAVALKGTEVFLWYVSCV